MFYLLAEVTSTFIVCYYIYFSISYVININDIFQIPYRALIILFLHYFKDSRLCLMSFSTIKFLLILLVDLYILLYMFYWYFI